MEQQSFQYTRRCDSSTDACGDSRHCQDKTLSHDQPQNVALLCAQRSPDPTSCVRCATEYAITP